MKKLNTILIAQTVLLCRLNISPEVYLFCIVGIFGSDDFELVEGSDFQTEDLELQKTFGFGDGAKKVFSLY